MHGKFLNNTHKRRYDDVIKWKHFPRYWPFVQGIPLSLVYSPHKGQWHGALMFSLICAWINTYVNNHEAGYLRCHLTHYDVIVMPYGQTMGCMLWFVSLINGLFKSLHCCIQYHLNTLVQDCSITSANALEILQSCTKPSISSCTVLYMYVMIKGRKYFRKYFRIIKTSILNSEYVSTKLTSLKNIWQNPVKYHLTSNVKINLGYLVWNPIKSRQWF